MIFNNILLKNREINKQAKKQEAWEWVVEELKTKIQIAKPIKTNKLEKRRKKRKKSQR